MSLSYQMLMKKASAQSQASNKEAATLLAEREAAKRKARQEADARAEKEREATKAKVLRDLELAREAAKQAQEQAVKEAERLERAKNAPLPTIASVFGDNKKPSAATLASRKIAAEATKSRSSSPRTSNHTGTSSVDALSREEKRAKKNSIFKDEPSIKGLYKSPQRNGKKKFLPGGGDRDHLVKLNTVKKDRRTIDEIQRDLDLARKRKSGDGTSEVTELVGDQAAGFKDWFGPSKKDREKERKRVTNAPSAASSSKTYESSQETIERAPSTGKKDRVSATQLTSSQRDVLSISASMKTSRLSPSSAGAAGDRKRPEINGSGKPSLQQPPRLDAAFFTGSKSSVTGKSNSGPAPVAVKWIDGRPVIASDKKRARSNDVSDLEPPARKRALKAATPAVREREYRSEELQKDRKRSRHQEESSEDEWSGSGSEEDGAGYKPGYIAALMGRNVERDKERERRLDDSDDSEDSDSEGGGRGKSKKRKTKSYGAEALWAEERRSLKAGQIEDRKEEEKERRRLEEKQKRKMLRKAELSD